MIRAFIALELPKETREGLAAIQAQLRRGEAGVRWVRPAAIHLTLKFLGNIPSVQVEEIVAATAPLVESESPLSLRAGGLGAFPSLRRPRVIWVGLTGEIERLQRLQARLEAALEPLGFPRESRPFRPHLTLGRVKHVRNPQTLANALTTLELPEFKPFDAAEIILYKSDLRPTGAIYTKLSCIPFVGSVPA